MLNTEYQPHLAADKEQASMQVMLLKPYVNGHERATLAYATEGHYGVSVPLLDNTLAKQDVAVDAQAWSDAVTAARKRGRRFPVYVSCDDARETITVAVAGEQRVSLPAAAPNGFPPFARLMADSIARLRGNPQAIAIGLNPKRLLDAAKAIGSPGSDESAVVLLLQVDCGTNGNMPMAESAMVMLRHDSAPRAWAALDDPATPVCIFMPTPLHVPTAESESESESE